MTSYVNEGGNPFEALAKALEEAGKNKGDETKGDYFTANEGSPADPNEQYVAPEGGITIKYGAGEYGWTKKFIKAGDSWRCDNNTFGDPAYGQAKSCFREVAGIGKSSSDIVDNGRLEQSGGDDTACIEPGCVFIRNYKTSLEKCKYDCLSDPACTNINYHSKDEGCQLRRCNDPKDPIGTRWPGWTMFKFIPTDPMDPYGKMSKLTAGAEEIGKIAKKANEYGKLAWSEASLLLENGFSQFGYILSVIGLIVLGTIITVFAWKTFVGSSLAINSSPPNIISR